MVVLPCLVGVLHAAPLAVRDYETGRIVSHSPEVSERRQVTTKLLVKRTVSAMAVTAAVGITLAVLGTGIFAPRQTVTGCCLAPGPPCCPGALSATGCCPSAHRHRT